jgi:hypothetical protein
VVSVSYAATLIVESGAVGGGKDEDEDEVEEHKVEEENEDVSVGVGIADERDLVGRGTRRTKSIVSSSSSSSFAGSALRGSPRFDSRTVFASPSMTVRPSESLSWPSLPRVYVTEPPLPSVTTKGGSGLAADISSLFASALALRAHIVCFALALASHALRNVKPRHTQTRKKS